MDSELVVGVTTGYPVLSTGRRSSKKRVVSCGKKDLSSTMNVSGDPSSAPFPNLPSPRITPQFNQGASTPCKMHGTMHVAIVRVMTMQRACLPLSPFRPSPPAWPHGALRHCL